MISQATEHNGNVGLVVWPRGYKTFFMLNSMLIESKSLKK